MKRLEEFLRGYPAPDQQIGLSAPTCVNFETSWKYVFDNGVIVPDRKVIVNQDGTIIAQLQKGQPGWMKRWMEEAIEGPVEVLVKNPYTKSEIPQIGIKNGLLVIKNVAYAAEMDYVDFRVKRPIVPVDQERLTREFISFLDQVNKAIT